MESARAVVVVMHVVFTRPQHLDRNTNLLGNRARLTHVVVGETTAETAADALQVDRDAGRGDAKRRRNQLAPLLRRLTRRPHFHLAVAEVCGAVLWLERRVREERIRI